MAWAYWELSGGAEFVPQDRPVAVATAPAEPAPSVTRADTAELSAIAAPDASTAVALPETAIEDLVAAVAQPATPEPEAIPAQPVVEAAAETVEPAADPLPVADLRVVIGDRVNLREGPGRDFGAIDQLAEGTVAEVLEVGENGWLRIQVQGTDMSGWMSADFLLPLNG